MYATKEQKGEGIMERLVHFMQYTVVLFFTLMSVVIQVGLIMFRSVIAFGFGYFIVWALTYTPIPNYIAMGLNIVFDTSRFTYDNLPLVFGTFMMLGVFFVPKIGVSREKGE